MTAISVLVPVYNAETYLRRCLDSVMGQIFADFEVVLIDDGSTDGSAAICREYAKRDNRVNFLAKRNEGVSATRQLAMDMAHGEYFLYVDADDWIEPEMLEVMYGTAVRELADMVECGFLEESAIGTVEHPMRHPDRVSLGMALVRGDWAVVWRMLIRRELCLSNGIRFPEGVDGGEDYVFCVKVWSAAERVCCVERLLYHYFRGNGNSIINSGGIGNLLHQIEATRIVERHLQDKGIDNLGPELMRRKQLYRQQLLNLDFERWTSTFPECSTDAAHLRTQGPKVRLVAWAERNGCLGLLKAFLWANAIRSKILRKERR